MAPVALSVDVKMKVFVSYRACEVPIGFLETAAQRLGREHRVFIHALSRTSMVRQRDVEARLADSDIMILCDTPGCRQSRWVSREIGLAKKWHIPVLRVAVDRKWRRSGYWRDMCSRLEDAHSVGSDGRRD